MTIWQIFWKLIRPICKQLYRISYAINGLTGGSFKELLCIRLYRCMDNADTASKELIYEGLIALIDFFAFKPRHCERMYRLYGQ